jgi:hypothetical protein
MAMLYIVHVWMTKSWGVPPPSWSIVIQLKVDRGIMYSALWNERTKAWRVELAKEPPLWIEKLEEKLAAEQVWNVKVFILLFPQLIVNIRPARAGRVSRFTTFTRVAAGQDGSIGDDQIPGAHLDWVFCARFYAYLYDAALSSDSWYGNKHPLAQ